MHFLRNHSSLSLRLEKLVFALFASLWASNLAACNAREPEVRTPPAPDSVTVIVPVVDTAIPEPVAPETTSVAPVVLPKEKPVDEIAVRYGVPRPRPRDEIMAKYGVLAKERK